jgi:hypothetical protein
MRTGDIWTAIAALPSRSSGVSTRVEIGTFFTKTNVSATQFGEGSFDKAIVIRLPIGRIGPLEPQSIVAMDPRPVQRDGGQMLAGAPSFYEENSAIREDEPLRQQSSIVGR